MCKGHHSIDSSPDPLCAVAVGDMLVTDWSKSQSSRSSSRPGGHRDERSKRDSSVTEKALIGWATGSQRGKGEHLTSQDLGRANRRLRRAGCIDGEVEVREKMPDGGQPLSSSHRMQAVSARMKLLEVKLEAGQDGRR